MSTLRLIWSLELGSFGVMQVVDFGMGGFIGMVEKNVLSWTWLVYWGSMTDLESFGTKALLLLVVSWECTDSTNLLCILQGNMHEQSHRSIRNFLHTYMWSIRNFAVLFWPLVYPVCIGLRSLFLLLLLLLLSLSLSLSFKSSGLKILNFFMV